MQSSRTLTTRLRRSLLNERDAKFPNGPQRDVAPQLASNPVETIRDLHAVYGRTVGLIAAGESVVLTCEPSFARRVLIDGSASAAFTKRGTAFFPNADVTGNGLLTSDIDTGWKQQRARAASAFAPSAVCAYTHTIARCCDELVQSTWAKGGTVNALNDLNAFTLQVISIIIFGQGDNDSTGRLTSEASYEIRSAISDALNAFINRSASPIPLPDGVPSPADVQLLSAVSRLNRSLDIRSRKHALETGQRSVRSLLDRLLQAHDENNEPMSIESARDEILTLLVAGQETSAILLAWSLAFLAIYPDACARVRSEADEAAARSSDCNGHPSYDDVMHMYATECVLLESMRMKPPAYMIGRCCDVDEFPIDENQNTTLLRGQTVLVAPALMHMDPEYWSEPERFSIDRWIPMLSNGSRIFGGMGPNGMYIPFGTALFF